MTDLSFPAEGATLTLEVDRDAETATDVAFLFEALDGLVVPSLWLAIALSADSDDGASPLRVARAALLRSASTDKAGGRFFPEFRQYADDGTQLPPIAVPGSDTVDATDYGAQVGMNAWVRSVLRDEEPAAYRELSSFVQVRRIQHESPLLIIATILAGTAAATAVVKGVTTVYELRRKRADALIREQEIKPARAEAGHADALADERLEQERARTRLLQAQARQAEAQALIHESLAGAVAGQASEALTQRAVEEAARAMAPAIDALAETPLKQIGMSGGTDRPG